MRYRLPDNTEENKRITLSKTIRDSGNPDAILNPVITSSFNTVNSVITSEATYVEEESIPEPKKPRKRIIKRRKK